MKISYNFSKESKPRRINTTSPSSNVFSTEVAQHVLWFPQVRLRNEVDSSAISVLELYVYKKNTLLYETPFRTHLQHTAITMLCCLTLSFSKTSKSSARVLWPIEKQETPDTPSAKKNRVCSTFLPQLWQENTRQLRATGTKGENYLPV
jgi:hypothetical protein